MFDYVLTGPISGVSAGPYLAGLINDLLQYFQISVATNGEQRRFGRAFVRDLVTVYFWWENIKGIPRIQRKSAADHAADHRDGGDPDRAGASTRFCCAIPALPPFPLPRNLKLIQFRLGWLGAQQYRRIRSRCGDLRGLGHSVLAMSGEESLAQVYREIEHPKLPNLKKAGLVIFIYSLVFTSLVSFFAVMIIPDGGSAALPGEPDRRTGHEPGRPVHLLRLVFHGFVVVVGTLILAGAVNTAIVGSNGVLNRVSEDGVLSATGSASRTGNSAPATGSSTSSWRCRL